jgi:hypothetical protein
MKILKTHHYRKPCKKLKIPKINKKNEVAFEYLENHYQKYK